MAPPDSALDAAALAKAQRLLATPNRKESIWPVLAAASFAAASALSLAVVTVVAPPARVEHLQRNAYGEFVRQ